MQALAKQQEDMSALLGELEGHSSSDQDGEPSDQERGEDARGRSRGRGRPRKQTAGSLSSRSPAPSPQPPPKRRGGRPKSTKQHKPPADFATLLKIIKPRDLELHQRIVQANQQTAAAARRDGAHLVPAQLLQKKAAAEDAAAAAMVADISSTAALQLPKRVDPCDTKGYKATAKKLKKTSATIGAFLTQRRQLLRLKHAALGKQYKQYTEAYKTSLAPPKAAKPSTPVARSSSRSMAFTDVVRSEYEESQVMAALQVRAAAYSDVLTLQFGPLFINATS